MNERQNDRQMKGREKPARWLARFSFTYAAVVLFSLLFLPKLGMLVIGAVCLLIGGYFLLNRRRSAALVFLAVVLACWQCWIVTVQTQRLSQTWNYEIRTLQMEVLDRPVESAYGSWTEVKVMNSGDLEGAHLQLYQSDIPDWPLGSLVEGKVTLRAMSGELIYSAQRYSDGIYLRASGDGLTMTPQKTPWYLYPKQLSLWLEEGVEACCRIRSSQLMLSIMTGNRQALSEELRQKLNDTGLSHIVAASGLHVHILIGAMLLLPGNKRRLRILAIPLMLFYGAMVGFSPSICRAIVMQTLLILGPLLGRESDGITSVAAAMLLLVLQNPYAMLSISLQLSFSAVLGIMLLKDKQPKLSKNPMIRSVQNTVYVTLSANALTTPLVIYWFGRFSVIAVISNLAVLWMLPILLPLACLIGVFGNLLPAAGMILAVPAHILTGLILAVVDLLAKIPWASLPGQSPLVICWLIFCYLAAAMVLLDHKKRFWKQALIIGVILLAVCIWNQNRVDQLIRNWEDTALKYSVIDSIDADS